MIYSVFPGLGKSYTARVTMVGKAIDAESSKFQWLDYESHNEEKNKGELKNKNPEWPKNYIDFIKSQYNENMIVFISAQPEILNALGEQNIPFKTITPDASTKDQIMARYESRGNNKDFINMMSSNFEKFITSMDTNAYASDHLKLKENHRLADLLIIDTL